MTQERLDDLRTRLARLVELDHPYPFRAARPGTAASVLLLLSLPETGDAIEVLVTRRTDRVETHKGQYALPGGVRDEEDADDVATALRENEEEMGIARDRVDAVGALPGIWTPTGFHVTPVVGLLREPRERVEILPNPHEIDGWFWCALDRLAHPEVYRQEEREITVDGRVVRVPMDVFQVGEHRIWGMTAAVLKNFIGRWEKLG
jgi:8-oxo-dGTP pyrophosphatase MutT (NUDIX family)